MLSRGRGRYEGDVRPVHEVAPHLVSSAAAVAAGVRHGHGTYTYACGSFFRYVGEWEGGVKHGHGTLLLGDGSSVEGEFLHGELTTTSASTRVGGEASGDADAEAASEQMRAPPVRRVFADGSVYVGAMVEGERCGEGAYTGVDGLSYRGAWRDNRFDSTAGGAHGVLVVPRASADARFRTLCDAYAAAQRSDADAAPAQTPMQRRRVAVERADRWAARGGMWVPPFVLAWPDDDAGGDDLLRDDRVRLSLAALVRYEGAWSRHRPSGARGRGEFVDGSVYDGEWRDGAPHGRGRVQYADGSAYEGAWAHGVRDGVGESFDAASGIRFHGAYRAGRVSPEDGAARLVVVVVPSGVAADAPVVDAGAPGGVTLPPTADPAAGAGAVAPAAFSVAANAAWAAPGVAVRVVNAHGGIVTGESGRVLRATVSRVSDVKPKKKGDPVPPPDAAAFTDERAHVDAATEHGVARWPTLAIGAPGTYIVSFADATSGSAALPGGAAVAAIVEVVA